MSKTSRGRRREEHEEHEEHVNHEAWVIPYADMLTLLMALFLVMFAVGRVDSEKFEALSESLRTNFGGTSQVVPIGGAGGFAPLNGMGIDGGPGILDGLGLHTPTDAVPDTIAAPAAAAGSLDRPGETGDPEAEASSGDATGQIVSAPPSDADIALAVQREAYAAAQGAYADLAAVEALVRAHALADGLGDAIGFRLEGRGLVVTIVTDRVLFADGSADIQGTGMEVLDVVAAALRNTDNSIAVEGHTDSRPISTARFPSNWELSTARATSVLRYMVDHKGFDADRISAAGYADTRPVASNDTPEGTARNRRVEIVVLSSAPLDPLLAT